MGGTLTAEEWRGARRVVGGCHPALPGPDASWNAGQPLDSEEPSTSGQAWMNEAG